MTAIRIKKKIDSENLHLPELKPLIERMVEIIVQDLTETKQDQAYEAFFALSGKDSVDPDAYKQGRDASMI